MKKLLTSLVAFVACCSFLAACGSNSDSASSNTTTTTHAPITKPLDTTIRQITIKEMADDLDGFHSESAITVKYLLADSAEFLNKGGDAMETILFSRQIVGDEREFAINTSTQRLVIREKGTLCDLLGTVTSNCRVFPKDSLTKMKANLALYPLLDTSLAAKSIAEEMALVGGDPTKISRQQQLVMDENAVCYFSEEFATLPYCVSPTKGVALKGTVELFLLYKATEITATVDPALFSTPDAIPATEAEISNATTTTVP